MDLKLLLDLNILRLIKWIFIKNSKVVDKKFNEDVTYTILITQKNLKQLKTI